MVLLAMAGCGQDDPSQGPIVERDSADIRIVENNVARLAQSCSVAAKPSVVIGGVEENEQQQLYRVFGAARLSDRSIALVNDVSKEVRVCERSGQLRRRMGRSGRGPGEFTDPFYLFLQPGDTIWAGNYAPFEFVVYTADGKYIRNVRPRPESYLPDEIELLGDGRILLGHSGDFNRTQVGVFEPRTLTAVLHDRNGVVIDTIGTYPNGRWGRTNEDGMNFTYRMFESFPLIVASGSRVFIGHGSEPEVRILGGTDSLRLEQIVRWTTPDRRISDDDVKAERKRIAEQYSGLPANQLDFEVNKRPPAEQLPAFGRAKLGRDGRIWVREYHRPGNTGPHRWLAFDSTGRFECSATIRPFTELFEFGRDYFIALDRDSLDVERVLEYSLHPAAVR